VYAAAALENGSNSLQQALQYPPVDLWVFGNDDGSSFVDGVQQAALFTTLPSQMHAAGLSGTREFVVHGEKK